MIKIGDSETTVFHGDQHPAEIWQGDQKIAGFEKAVTNGEGRVEINDQPYNASLPSVTVHGEGKQDKLEGKNLFDINSINTSSLPKTSNGITLEMLSDKQFRLHGKLTDLSKGAFFGFQVLSTFSKVYTAGTYSTYRKYIQNRDIEFFCTPKKLNGSPVGKNIDGNHVVIAEDFKLSNVGVFMSSNITESVDLIIPTQLELASSITPYEPYCGGIPAPNPQYPIEPVFLEGASVVGRGRNILPNSRWVYENIYIPGLVKVQIVTDGTRSEGGNVVIKNKSGYELYVPIDAGSTKSDVYWVRDIIQVNNSLNSPEHHSFGILGESELELPYTPFYDGGTAPLPILRALPDGSVRDEMDVVSGTVVRRIGEIILTGDEYITKSNFVEALSKKEAYQIGRITPRIDTAYKPFSNCLIGHSWAGYFYANTIASAVTDMFVAMTDGVQTTDEFIAMLKEKYTAGNPVTIWYALETPIIEHYDPTILRQHPGYTQLIQQGGFAPAPIEATYYQKEKEVI